MRATSSYVWLLLVVFCCWHSMAMHTRDKTRVPTHSSSSDESSSSEDEKCGTCTDHRRNQDETDIDCGGEKCSKCAARKKCLINCDCISNICKNGICDCKPTNTTTETTTVVPSVKTTVFTDTTTVPLIRSTTARETTIEDRTSTMAEETTTTPTKELTTEEAVSTTEGITSAMPDELTTEEEITMAEEITTAMPEELTTEEEATTAEAVSTTGGITTATPDELTTEEETTMAEEITTAMPEELTTEEETTTTQAVSTTERITTATPNEMTTKEAVLTTEGITTATPDELTTEEETTRAGKITTAMPDELTTEEKTTTTEAVSTTEGITTATPDELTTEGETTTTEAVSSVEETTTTPIEELTTEEEPTTTTTRRIEATTAIPDVMRGREATTAILEVTRSREATTATPEVTTRRREATTATTKEITTTTLPTCDRQCKNGGTCTSHNQCTCTSDFSGPTCEVQSVGLCLDKDTFGVKPILLITFGQGRAQFSSATPAQYNFGTTYKQQMRPSVEDGHFSFINSIYNHNGAWHTNAKDHTEDEGGYMYLVNANVEPGEFYKGRVDNLCVGLRYEFSVYLANVCKVSDRIDPDVRFEVRSVDGKQLLAQLNSGRIPESKTLTWQKYGFSFIATNSSVNLLMISNARGGGGNDLVIDDIALRVCAHKGPGFCPSH